MLESAPAHVTHSKSDSEVAGYVVTFPSLSGLIIVHVTLFPSFYFFFPSLRPEVEGQAVAQLEEEHASSRLEPV